MMALFVLLPDGRLWRTTKRMLLCPEDFQFVTNEAPDYPRRTIPLGEKSVFCWAKWHLEREHAAETRL